jgi:polyisoprenyl-teichoic acid--peptidoglycan teichoic acid transferase
MVAKLEEKLIKQRRLRRRKVLVVIGLLTLLAVVAAIASYLWFGGKIGARRAKVNKSPDTEHYIVPPNKLNIMIMGVDERPQEDDPGRSDTLLVMTIDTESREASIVSVPRDTRLRIKGLGWDKVNHAFSVGGVALTRQTTEAFLGIPMDYYAKVNLESFGRIVDAIGGVTIDVEKRMQYEDTWDHYVIDLKPGVQRLDGRAALQYVRYRDEEGDIGRISRQQKFIKAVLAEVSSPAIILKAPSIIREVFASLDTDMPIGLMMGLARKLKDGLSGGFKPHMVEGLPYYIDDISYWVPDIVKTRQMVAEMQGVPFEGNVRIAAQRAADEYHQAFPANAHLDDGTYYPGMDQAAKQTKPGQKAPATAPVKSVVPPTKTQSPTTPTKPASTPPAKPTTPTKPTSALPVRVAIGLNNGV